MTKERALKAYELTENQYSQVMAYVQEHNLSPDTTLCVDVSADGTLQISIERQGCVTTPSGKGGPSLPRPSMEEDYVYVTMESEKPPVVHVYVTDQIISKGFAIIFMAWSAFSLACQLTHAFLEGKAWWNARKNGGNSIAG